MEHPVLGSAELQLDSRTASARLLELLKGFPCYCIKRDLRVFICEPCKKEYHSYLDTVACTRCHRRISNFTTDTAHVNRCNRCITLELAEKLVKWTSVTEMMNHTLAHPSKSPFCEHSTAYSYSEDGGKTIRCLLCSEAKLKEQAANVICYRAADGSRVWTDQEKGKEHDERLRLQAARETLLEVLSHEERWGERPRDHSQMIVPSDAIRAMGAALEDIDWSEEVSENA